MQSFSLSFFYATLKQEPSVKNKRDRLFFAQLFVPQASQSSYYRRTKVCFMTYGIFCMAGRRKIRKQGEARCALNG